jgi:phage shock protein PspC (stress-responsive transcriptional regulator)
MKTVIHVSLSGHAKTFQLEEEAYKALQDYLGRARSRLSRDPDHEEVLRDLEQSIGEKLGKSLRGDNRVVSRKEVEVVLDEVGAVNTGNGNGDAAAPASDAPRFSPPRRLCRIEEGKWFFGVCQGLAAYSNIAVEWVRAIFVIVTVFTGGLPILIYLVMMFVVPTVATRSEYDASVRTYGTA